MSRTQLAKVALGPAAIPAAAAAFNGLGVAARVEALLQPARLRHEGVWTSSIGLGIASVAVAADVQIHHVAELLVTLCAR